MPHTPYHTPKKSICPSTKCTTTSTAISFEVAVIDPKGGQPVRVLQCSLCGAVVGVMPDQRT